MAKEKTEMETLIGFQQGELDAVYMYQELSKIMKTEEDKKLMLSLASDEGRHASIIKQYTENTDLKPSHTLGNLVKVLYKIVGRKLVFSVMAKQEYAAEARYKPYYEKYPRFAELGPDEIKHGNILTQNR